MVQWAYHMLIDKDQCVLMCVPGAERRSGDVPCPRVSAGREVTHDV